MKVGHRAKVVTCFVWPSGEDCARRTTSTSGVRVRMLPAWPHPSFPTALWWVWLSPLCRWAGSSERLEQHALDIQRQSWSSFQRSLKRTEPQEGSGTVKGGTSQQNVCRRNRIYRKSPAPRIARHSFFKIIENRHPLERVVYKTTQPQEHYHLSMDGCSYLLGWTLAPPRRRHMALQLAECSFFRQRNGCFGLMGDVVKRVGCWIHSCLPRQSGAQVPGLSEWWLSSSSDVSSEPCPGQGWVSAEAPCSLDCLLSGHSAKWAAWLQAAEGQRGRPSWPLLGSLRL